MNFKPDAEDIRLHLETIQNQFVANQHKKQWSKFCFHFTPIESAASILNSRLLRSRKNCHSNNIPLIDIASREILAQTSVDILNYVRFYFRPKTPMQFSIEGFRTPNQIRYDKQCGVPVVLMFDSEILTHEGCLCSDRNTSMSYPRPQIGGSAAFFQSLDFEKIFQEGIYNPAIEKGER